MQFQLYWPREREDGEGIDLGCDAVPLRRLPPAIRDTVGQLAGGDDGCDLRLPYFDRAQMSMRSFHLRRLGFERYGRSIRAVTTPVDWARDLAAIRTIGRAEWRNAGWRARADLSVALQHRLRTFAAFHYFRDIERMRQVRRSYTMLVYLASRIRHPRSSLQKGVLTWDGDFVGAASRIGSSLRRGLSVSEHVLIDEGRLELARKYSPLWHEDVRRAVLQRPRAYAELLWREARVIEAVAALDGSAAQVKALGVALDGALRSMHGMDMRALAPGLIGEAVRLVTKDVCQEGVALVHD